MITSSALSDFATRLRELMARGALLTTAPNASCDGQFDSLALELYARQRTLNPAYRTLAQLRRAHPAPVKRWTDIPSVPTSAFKELELTCLPPEQRMAVFCSSGTTGQQASRHFHCAESLALYQAASWAWFRTHLVPEIEGACAALAPKATTDSSSASAPAAALPAQPQPPQLVILTPPAVEAPQSSLVHMFETINGRLGGTARFCGAVDKDGSWSVDLARVEAVLEQSIRAGRAVLLLGTAFSYVHCLDDWSTRGRRFALPSGSGVLETGGYKGRSRSLPKEELHRQLCAGLGVPDEAIISEYGMSELTSQAYDGVIGTPHRRHGSSRLFRFPPWARAQVISPETGHEVAPGQTGLLRIVDLANVWSVLAVQTEDLAVRHPDGFEFIGRAAQAEARGCSLMVR